MPRWSAWACLWIWSRFRPPPCGASAKGLHFQASWISSITAKTRSVEAHRIVKDALRGAADGSEAASRAATSVRRAGLLLVLGSRRHGSLATGPSSGHSMNQESRGSTSFSSRGVSRLAFTSAAHAVFSLTPDRPRPSVLGTATATRLLFFFFFFRGSSSGPASASSRGRLRRADSAGSGAGAAVLDCQLPSRSRSSRPLDVRAGDIAGAVLDAPRRRGCPTA
mmetsp:Transcript_42441/g.120970  ORF Transcript_42441/g.120970 Transcript_42441/m.120970 type:complete len:223 (-) Transcript_42441:7-675(-)